MSSISNSLKRPQRAAALRSHLPQDLVACVGEFVGTTAFLFLALGGAKTALVHASDDTNSTVMFVACSFGLSILVTIWSFYRITGGLFSPAVTLSLLLCGCVSPLRAAMLTVAQIAGGIAGAALVEGLLSSPTHVSVATTLGDGVSIVQGLFIEALCTAVLVFVVLMLAAEKHSSTMLAPVGVGLTVFACHLLAVPYTGSGLNPARSFGPSVVAGHFEGYHWIYWAGPLLGSVGASAFYLLLKTLDYTRVVPGQDATHADPASAPRPLHQGIFRRRAGGGQVIVYAVDTEERLASMSALDRAVARATPQVQLFDPLDQAQAGAVQAGEAVIIDLGEPGEAHHDDGACGGPSMAAQRQDVGGICAPGTAPGGLPLPASTKAGLSG